MLPWNFGQISIYLSTLWICVWCFWSQWGIVILACHDCSWWRWRSDTLWLHTWGGDFVYSSCKSNLVGCKCGSWWFCGLEDLMVHEGNTKLLLVSETRWWHSFENSSNHFENPNNVVGGVLLSLKVNKGSTHDYMSPDKLVHKSKLSCFPWLSSWTKEVVAAQPCHSGKQNKTGAQIALNQLNIHK